MAMNMTTLVSGILLGFFITVVLCVNFTNMSAAYGVPQSVSNGSISFTNTLNAANQIGNVTKVYGAMNPLAYFPGLGTLFQVWDVVSSAVGDFTGTFDNMVTMFGGDYYLLLFKNLMIAIIIAGITFLVLAALFKLGNSWSIR